MTLRHHDTDIDAALRRLDPAPHGDLTDDQRQRADALFARLTSSPAPAPARAAMTSRTRRRAGAIAVAAGAATVGIAAPALLGGGGAFASWTPTPEPIGSAELPAVESACRDNLRVVDQGETVVLAERRGGWIFILLEGPHSEMNCLMPESLVGAPVDDGGGVMGGWSPEERHGPPSLGPDELAEETSAMGAFDDDWYTYTQGYVGADVVAVEVHVSTGLDIEASLDHGQFAAWWPGEPQSSTVPAETWTYSVTLADGTTREIAPSTLYGE